MEIQKIGMGLRSDESFGRFRNKYVIFGIFNVYKGAFNITSSEQGENYIVHINSMTRKEFMECNRISYLDLITRDQIEDPINRYFKRIEPFI